MAYVSGRNKGHFGYCYFIVDVRSMVKLMIKVTAQTKTLQGKFRQESI